MNIDTTMTKQPEAAATEELGRLWQRASQGDRTALPALRQLLDERPDIWREAGDLAGQAERAWVLLAAGNDLAVQECLTRKLAELRAELGAEEAPPLERLLIDRIVICWLQTAYADAAYAQARGAGQTLAHGNAAERRQNRAQSRYVQAIRSLALVRKMTRPPLSPVEIATRIGSSTGRAARTRETGLPAVGVGVEN